jgi:predicted glycoside hydrolase/deacetylase ChbG (UPF0249 family)
MIRRVVFNADDFGASRQENRGIVELVRAGVVREVSMLVTNGSAFEDAVNTIRENQLEVGIGLHFSLTLGSAVTGPMPGITKSDGRFASLSQVLARAMTGKIRSEPIEHELRAQLERLRALGIRPSHLNGHHHVHVFPGVRDAVIAVLRDFRGLHLRIPLERPFVSGSARRAVIAALAAAFLIRASGELADFRRLPFVGLGLGDAEDHASAFEELARLLPTPIAEWIIHPTEKEIATLVSPKTRELLAKLEIVPSRYSDFADA